MSDAGNDGDVDAFLATEVAQASREKEIDRIMDALRLDAYAILDLRPGAPADVIHKQYRRKSLLIHPDKTPDKRAPEAFDILKSAQTKLLDDEGRKYLDSIYTDARRMLINEKDWTLDDERLNGDEFRDEWKQRVEELLVEDELRRRKLHKLRMEAEGRERERQEQLREVQRQRKLKEKLWEDARDERVNRWRKHVKKKHSKSTRKSTLG